MLVLISDKQLFILNYSQLFIVRWRKAETTEIWYFH